MQSKSVWNCFSPYAFFKAAAPTLNDRELSNDKDKLNQLITRIGSWDKYSWVWQQALPIASWAAYAGGVMWWISSGTYNYFHPSYTRRGEVAWALGHTETIDTQHYDCEGTYVAYTHHGLDKPKWDCISTGGSCCVITNGPGPIWQTLLSTAGFIGGGVACAGVSSFAYAY